MWNVLKASVIAVVMAGTPVIAAAQSNVITLEGARIRGGQEAPLVLYLVPWQPPEARSLDRPDEELMLARPVRPLERAEFQRLIGYHEHFQALNRPETAPDEVGGRSE
ncbi:hypothetical protein [Marinobacter halotolerans]|uniref:hypothetical protein n=1 Tax=Marinobacter halotolerans TaxID=1569211 RepID=UPI001CD95EB1|nr:hypothetical protein [Marinobacter halotolerans]